MFQNNLKITQQRSLESDSEINGCKGKTHIQFEKPLWEVSMNGRKGKCDPSLDIMLFAMDAKFCCIEGWRIWGNVEWGHD